MQKRIIMKYARYPNLNANINGGLNFGRTIDPTSNDFINQRIGNSQLSMTSIATLYNGGMINNSIKKSEYNAEAAKADAKGIFQDIALQISSIYLNVLLAKEQLVITKNQLKQTLIQLEETDKRIEAGILPKNERLEIIAQQARNQQSLITAKNDLTINLLDLKNLLELEPNHQLDVIPPTDNIPQIEKILSLLRIESAELAIPIAMSQRLPKLDVFAQINSNYANIQDFENEKYFNQLSNNLGQLVGLQLSVPIYNRHSTNVAIEKAKLELVGAQVMNKQAKQKLKADIQNAIANAIAAEAEYQANQTSLDAAKASYANAKDMYDLGAINTLEFTNTKTNMDTAELNIIRAKYNYIFRMKIIDFYLGVSF